VETKWFVGSFVNVILTRQTCGQRSSRAAESKHRALGNYFSERICYVSLTSKCRGDRDLGLCTTSGLAFGEPMRNGDSQKTKMFRRRKNWTLQYVTAVCNKRYGVGARACPQGSDEDDSFCVFSKKPINFIWWHSLNAAPVDVFYLSELRLLILH